MADPPALADCPHCARVRPVDLDFTCATCGSDIRVAPNGDPMRVQARSLDDLVDAHQFGRRRDRRLVGRLTGGRRPWRRRGE